MRQAMTIRLAPEVLSAAKARARTENRTLTNYIETLMRKDLHLEKDQAGIEVIAPADIRGYEPIALDGETPERRRFRRELFKAILDEGGY